MTRPIRDKSPASMPVDEPSGPAEAGFAGKHDGLITVLDANLVEHPCNMISNRFFREPKRCGDLGVVQTRSNPFEHGALARIS
jgi:hypothetical protein